MNNLLEELEKEFEMADEHNPTSFGGFKIKRKQNVISRVIHNKNMSKF